MVAAEPRIEVRERTSATALWSDGERCHGVLTDAGPIAAAATVLATGGAAALWRRTTNPRGAIGAGPVLAAAAGADLADLEFCQFHPTALALPGSPFDGVLITEAIRGEGAKLLDAAGERFTDELAPRDAVTAAILDRMRADGARGREARPARDRPGPLPQRLRLARRRRPRPALRAGAGRPRRPLHDGRDRGGPRRPLLAARPLRGRRVLLHRPARRQPARLQLAQRVLRLRRPRRRRGRSARPAAASGRRSPSGASSRRPRRPATRSGAAPARSATPTTWRALVSNPYPLAKAIASCALSRRESRGGHLRTDCPETDPGLDGIHLVLAPDGEVRREELAVASSPCCSESTSAGPSPTPSCSTPAPSTPPRSRPRPATSRPG